MSEPITLFTDGALGIQSIGMGLSFLLKYLLTKTQKNKREILLIFYFLSLGIFAILGSICHFTPIQEIYDQYWPWMLIFGGFALFSFHLFIVNNNIDSIKDKQNLHYIFSGIILLTYWCILIVVEWSFTYFGYYLVVVSAYFMLLSANKKVKASHNPINPIIFNYLIVILILGIIQTIAKNLGWNYYFGTDSTYLVQPGNEIFHILALFANYYLYKKIQKFENL